MAAHADCGHGPRLWQGERLSGLELPQEEAGLQARGSREGRRLHFAVQSDEGFVGRALHEG